MTLFEAVVTYLRLKGRGRGMTFHPAAERSCGYVIDTCGDKPLTGYTKADANAFRDALIARGMAGSSITRIFGTVRSVITFAASEEGVDLTNPFGKVHYDRQAGVSDRQAHSRGSHPGPTGRVLPPGRRYAMAGGPGSGHASSGGGGTALRGSSRRRRWPDHRTDRTQDVAQARDGRGAREIPLVGSARWAAERILQARAGTTNANAASAGLNKWLKAPVPDGAAMHGFRHAMRDRLRAVECPSDIVDQIGG